MTIQRHVRRTLIAALLPLLFLPQPASAQRFKWWQAEHVQRELSLTKEQVTRLEEIFQSYLPTLRKEKNELDREEAEFNKRVAAGDHAGALALVDRVELARSALNRSRAHQLLYMRRVLTADQHAKLTALQGPGGRSGEPHRGDPPR
jgi:Spy/CpxP family protein refolding chaperone